MEQLKSQMFGVGLALVTAIGCVFYEKIVKHFSFLTFQIILLIEVLCLCLVGYFIFPNELKHDMQKIQTDTKYIWWMIIYIFTGISSLLWFVITKNQGVMISSLYEVKYIVMLAIIYILFGSEKFTINTGIGVCLALASIYFISKK